MNRRNFLKFLSAASVGATVAYSFPSIIVPKNIELVKAVIPATIFDLDEINRITREEVYPRVIEDYFFNDTPFISYLREKRKQGIVANSFNEAMHITDETNYRIIKIDKQITTYYKELQEEIDKRIH